MLQTYLENIKYPNVKASTYDRNECVLNNQIKGKPIGKMWANQITPEYIQQYLLSLTGTLSRSSVKKVYDLLGEFYKYMVNAKLFNNNPMLLVKMPHESKFVIKTKKMEILETEEVTRVIKVAEETKEDGSNRFRYGEVVILLVLTGLRSGEIRALKLDDIDFNGKVLYIKQGISRHKDRVNGGVANEVAQPKTINGLRSVPLCERALLAAKRLASKTYDPNTGYLITTTKGRLLSHKYLQDTYDYILKEAGIPHKGLHSTRHSFATITLKDAEDKGQIKEVSEMLGHSEVSTTYKYYINTSDKDKRKLVSIFDHM